MATVTKLSMAHKVFEAGVGNLAEAIDFVDETIEMIKDALARGEDVLVSGFGTFRVRDKKARKGRNPKTGEKLIVASRRVVKFHASGELRKRCKATVYPEPGEGPTA
jgi:integration host factor subunit alpha